MMFSTFSTGFSTIKRDQPYTHRNSGSRFLESFGQKCRHSAFYKKESRRIFFAFYKPFLSGDLFFSNLEWLVPSFQHRAAAVFLCGKGGENCSFPHWKSAGGVQMMCRCAAMAGDRRFRMPAALLWASSAEKCFFSLGQRSACGRSAVPFSRERAWTAGGRSRACFLWKRRCGGKVFADD